MFIITPIVCRGCVEPMFYAVICVCSSFAIISLGKTERVALLSRCHVAVILLCLFLTVLLVDLRYVDVAFPGHTHLLLNNYTGSPVFSI